MSFLLLYLIYLLYNLPYVHIYAMSLETESILHCLMCVTLSWHYIGKIPEHSLTTQYR